LGSTPHWETRGRPARCATPDDEKEIAVEIADTLIALGGSFLAAGLIARAGTHIGLPTIPLFMVAGIALGPHTPGLELAPSGEELELLASMGLVFLLFYLGLEFSPRTLADGGRSLIIGVTSAVVSGLIAAAAGIGSIGTIYHLGSWLVAAGGALLALAIVTVFAARRASLARGEPTVERQDLPRDERRGVGAEQQRGADDVIGVGDPMQRDPLFETGAELLVGEQVRRLRRGDERR
jgi:hypothetical protein